MIFPSKSVDFRAVDAGFFHSGAGRFDASRYGKTRMATSDSEQAMTRLLLEASTQHLHLTLEPLPVGAIALNDHGVILSIDASTSAQLGYRPSVLLGISISVLFQESCFAFLESIRTRNFGYVGKIELRTRFETTLYADLVLTESLEPHKYDFTLLFGSEI